MSYQAFTEPEIDLSSFDVAETIKVRDSLREFTADMFAFSASAVAWLDVAQDQADSGIVVVVGNEDLLKLAVNLAHRLAMAAGLLDGLTEALPNVRDEAGKRASNAISLKRRAELAEAGRIGGNAKSRATDEIKSWAEQQAKAMKGADLDIARRLAAQIPEHLAGASKNPERLIYEHLRARRNTAS